MAEFAILANIESLAIESIQYRIIIVDKVGTRHLKETRRLTVFLSQQCPPPFPAALQHQAAANQGD